MKFSHLRLFFFFSLFFLYREGIAQIGPPGLLKEGVMQVGVWQFNNFSGIQGGYLNPASLSDSRIGWQVQLGSFYTQGGIKNTDNPNNHVLFSETSLKLSKQTWSPVYTDVRGPGFMFQFPNRHAFSISTRYRAASYQTFFGNSSANVNRGWTTEAFNEIGVSYALPIWVHKQHHIKAGATYKFIGGVYYDDLVSQGELAASRFTGTLLNTSTKFNKPFEWTNLYPSKSSGSALDMGIVYDFVPDFEQHLYPMDGKTRIDVTENKYLVRIGLSMLDYGSFAYKGVEHREGSFPNQSVPATFGETDLPNDLRKLLTERSPQSQPDLTRRLPTLFVINADVRLGKKGWYINALLNSANAKNNIGFYSPKPYTPFSVVALTPRYEKYGAEFSMPFSYWRQTQQWSMGLHIKIGGLFFGTESINSLFGGSKSPAPTVYAGFSIQGWARVIKDTDGDAVSNRRDECPDLAGLWAFKGCPDRDGDGIKDSEDQCPEHAGPKETKGCPDSDGDGIFDKNDACPNAAGPQKFNGCPDTDNDGVPDSEDACPQKAGLPEFGGCPDTDGDGLMDNEDDCPEAKGSKLLRGCPDTDGDGIVDKNDRCPDQKGTPENGGCPDTDNDGVNDSADECPNEIGWKALDGCLPKAFFKSDSVLSSIVNTTLKNLSTQLLAQSSTEVPGLDSLQSWLNQHPNQVMEVVFAGPKAEKLKAELMPFVQKTLLSLRYEAKVEPQLSPTATGLLVRFVTKP